MTGAQLTARPTHAVKREATMLNRVGTVRATAADGGESNRNEEKKNTFNAIFCYERSAAWKLDAKSFFMVSTRIMS